MAEYVWDAHQRLCWPVSERCSGVELNRLLGIVLGPVWVLFQCRTAGHRHVVVEDLCLTLRLVPAGPGKEERYLDKGWAKK